jgi:hypothetical protein
MGDAKTRTSRLASRLAMLLSFTFLLQFVMLYVYKAIQGTWAGDALYSVVVVIGKTIFVMIMLMATPMWVLALTP